MCTDTLTDYLNGRDTGGMVGHFNKVSPKDINLTKSLDIV